MISQLRIGTRSGGSLPGVDLPDSGYTWSKNANGRSNKANKLLVELRLRRPLPLWRRRQEKAKKAITFDALVLEDKPIWPKVVALPKFLPNKEMIPVGVSTKKSEKKVKGLLVEANVRIRRLEILPDTVCGRDSRSCTASSWRPWSPGGIACSGGVRSSWCCAAR